MTEQPFVRRMYLNDKKVAKHFGAHPERGRRISGVFKRVTVGVRWSLPKKDYVPDDNVLVNPVLALKCIRRGYWEVTVEKQFAAVAEKFLTENCI